MSDIVIDCENLGKQYRLGSRVPYHRFSDMLVGWAKLPYTLVKNALSSASRHDDSGSDDFWALREINLQVRHGEVIGIVGHNGAGKSTFFKLLSRITAPTTGRATVTGRVGTLLEVGTGFHPELTGRENIYLYGAILGMSRNEIKRKFDTIVDFAEIEQFLDTPVKRFSSGMYMRLAFSVAAHLDTEILLVDEVLAVGDAAFQDKCLGKMGEVGKSGRTVIFVSHNMSAVRRLCTKAVLLDHGRNIAEGPVPEILAKYQARFDKDFSDGPVDLSKWPLRYPGCGQTALFTQGTIFDKDGKMTSHVLRNESMEVELRFTCPQQIRAEFSAVCAKYDGQGALHISQYDAKVPLLTYDAGEHVIRFKVELLPLLPGSYFWNFALHFAGQQNVHDLIFETMKFSVHEDSHTLRPFTSTCEVAVCTTSCSWVIDNQTYPER